MIALYVLIKQRGLIGSDKMKPVVIFWGGGFIKSKEARVHSRAMIDGSVLIVN